MHSIVTTHVKRLIEGSPLKQSHHVALSQLAHDRRNCKICCAGIVSAGLNTQHTIACRFKRLPRHHQDKYI